jgi:hypothetical protein
MLKIIHITEGIRIFKRVIKVKRKGIKKYNGNSIEICKKIVDDCYNKKKGYFMVSAGHFSVFYCRDFGWIVKSLIKLGYKDKVRNTLEYALRCFKKYGRVMTTINPQGKPFDFPTYAVDSLPYLLYSLSCIDDKKIVDKYKIFLENQIKYFFNYVVDKKTGLVRKDKFFSSMKDHSKRKSSCYDNCMLYMIQKSCDELSLFNPFVKFNYAKLIKENFWTGEYFLDDLSGKKYVAGDANLFPFWTGAINDKSILNKSITAIQKNKLDNPFPLKYTSTKEGKVDFKVVAMLVNNYEGNSIWMHMGPLYVDVVGKVDKKLQKKYLIKYNNLIINNQNFLEVFNSDGSFYKTLFYCSDEGMLWCANYLYLIKEVGL